LSGLTLATAIGDARGNGGALVDRHRRMKSNEAMVTYEQLLKRDRRRGFLEGSMHFERESAVHKSLERIVRRLEELGIPYAIAGAMAMFFHGYERFTTDVDILVTKEGLRQIHERLEDLGYVPPFKGSKQLRDTESGVRIEFLTTGD